MPLPGSPELCPSLTGQERFRCLVPSYLRDCHVVLVCFDVTNLCTQADWVELAQKERFGRIRKPFIILVGNKVEEKLSKRRVGMFNMQGNVRITQRVQLFRETLSEKSTKLHKPISKGSMGRRIELLHVLNTNEI